MKAMILAAGLGTRLRPLTDETPKPLFPVGGTPLLDLLIRRLQHAGCEAVIINTHHLAPQIEAFLRGQSYPIPVLTRHEPILLETGGAIKNVEDFWDERPFLVVNGDIYTNIDLQEVYRFHLGHSHQVTMVLHDCNPFNHVWLDGQDRVIGFGKTGPCPPRADHGKHRERLLAFTGIQVLDPAVLGFIPAKTPYGIINAYCEMIHARMPIQGYVVKDHFWHDIGTLDGYRRAAGQGLVEKSLPENQRKKPSAWAVLKGDGSDRRWHRVTRGETSVILVDHGPLPQVDDRTDRNVCEADAFFFIGNHLREKGVPVPRIFGYDRPQGIIALEDCGDVHLQTLVRQGRDGQRALELYQQVLEALVIMAVKGAEGFDTTWTYQTAAYDRTMVLEKECRYFVSAFLNGFMGRDVPFSELKPDFEHIAESASNLEYSGFIHRDFQSRNILVQDDRCRIIDFQGGRLGPLQYDLASLLIDPYVEIPTEIQTRLSAYYLERLSEQIPVDRDAFLLGLRYCAVTRNLQALGAFGFLSRQKNKPFFEAFVPPAVRSLKYNVERLGLPGSSPFRRLVQNL